MRAVLRRDREGGLASAGPPLIAALRRALSKRILAWDRRRIRIEVSSAGRYAGVRGAAAVAALRQWVFKPGLLDGKPTATWVQQLMTFRLQ